MCVFAKLDQFLPVRSHFDTKRPVNFFHKVTVTTQDRPLNCKQQQLPIWVVPW